MPEQKLRRISNTERPRRPYYSPTCFFFDGLFDKNESLFRSSYTISRIIVACETRLTEIGIPTEPNLCWCKLNILSIRLRGHAGHPFLVFLLHTRIKYSTKCSFFSRIYTISSIYILVLRNTPYGNRRMSRTKPVYGKLNILD